MRIYTVEHKNVPVYFGW